MARFAVEKTLADVLATLKYLPTPMGSEFHTWELSKIQRLSVGRYVCGGVPYFYISAWFMDSAEFHTQYQVAEFLWESHPKE